MADPEYLDTVRARGFGAEAQRYDRSRPTYPDEMVVDLLADGPLDIVDVGCGTGTAARLFLGAGRRLVGVEPDARMAAVAADHGIDVEVSDFESWDSGGRRFDLLVSGTAWHWVDPAAGTARAAEVLRPGGRFAAFWNAMHHGPAVRAVFDRVYGRHAPAMLRTSFALGLVATIDETDDPYGEALAAGPFDGVVVGERRTYPWSTTYTPQEWVDLAATHSDHLLLDAGIRTALFDDLLEALSALGTSFAVALRTDLLTAVRR
jgi:SAM-dependent methyltransferase